MKCVRHAGEEDRARQGRARQAEHQKRGQDDEREGQDGEPPAEPDRAQIEPPLHGFGSPSQGERDPEIGPCRFERTRDEAEPTDAAQVSVAQAEDAVADAHVAGVPSLRGSARFPGDRVLVLVLRRRDDERDPRQSSAGESVEVEGKGQAPEWHENQEQRPIERRQASHVSPRKRARRSGVGTRHVLRRPNQRWRSHAIHR